MYPCNGCCASASARRVQIQAPAQPQSYSSCDASQEVADGGIALGSAGGQVSLDLAASTYTVVAHSISGNDFTMTRSAAGPMSYACTTVGKGGCKGGGRW